MIPTVVLRPLLLAAVPLLLAVAAERPDLGGAVATIDQLVAAQLAERHLTPAPPCDDATFIRRVHLDAIGTLPTAEEVRGFLASPAADKRARLIDQVLDREEFADYWSLKWCDLLRVKAEFPSKLWPNAVQAYHRWVREAIRTGMPYDVFVRTLLTASGSNFRDPPVNFWRAIPRREPHAFATDVALIFLGLRLDKAGFAADRLRAFDAAFTCIGFKPTDEWKEEIVYFDRRPLLTGDGAAVLAGATGLDGTPLKIPVDTDPRRALAAWLTGTENPWFAKALANRTWYWLTGQGIVHEPDDLRPDNPAWSPALLDHLAAELRAHGHDFRHLFCLILNSQTWQRAAGDDGPGAGFAFYQLRRLDAEPLLDAINQITASGERYVSAIPEPFTHLPWSQHAIALADGSIEIPFLTTFGRPPRNTPLESERSIEPSVPQAQFLLNSSHVQRKLEQCRTLKQVVDKTVDHARIVDEVYLHILSRPPRNEERKIALSYLDDAARSLHQSACDLAWALINTKEFILRH